MNKNPTLVIGINSGGKDKDFSFQKNITLPPELTDFLQLVSITNGKSETSIRSQNIKSFVIEGNFKQGLLSKFFYEYAIRHGFDYVWVINQDEFIQILPHLKIIYSFLDENKSAEVLSLPVTSGNQVISWMQVLLFKKNFKNLYTHNTIYKTTFLHKTPFRKNTDSFHFHAELCIQALIISTTRLITLPEDAMPVKINFSTPSFLYNLYHSCLFLLKYLVHKSGAFYKSNFDCISANHVYHLKTDYISPHSLSIREIKPGARVIDIGAGPESIASLLNEKGCKVTTVDMFPLQKNIATENHIIADLNEPLSFSVKEYDYILLLDILEHLKDPEDFLFRLSAQFTDKKQKIFLSTGNVAFFILRLSLLSGRFNYGKYGILDKTHTQLFTFSTFKRLIMRSGMKFISIKGIPPPYPKVFGKNLFSKILLHLHNVLIRVSKRLFSYQIFIEAETCPGVEFYLQQTKY